MNPNEALDILNQITQQVSASRDVHQKIVIALECLKKIVEEKEAINLGDPKCLPE